MQNNPRVSVVIATYNGGRYIRAQLDSILGQTRVPDEIVVVDDGSRDDTLEILAGYARLDPSVRVIRNDERLGINGNFRKALLASKGDFVFISDQDDVWVENKIAAMLAAWKGEDLVYSEACIIDQDDRELYKAEGEYFGTTPIQGKKPASFLFDNCVSGHNAMVTRHLVELCCAEPFPDQMLYDQWLALVASLHGGIGFLPTVLCRHRLHGSNANNNLALKKKRKAGRREDYLEKTRRLREFSRALGRVIPAGSPISDVAAALQAHCRHPEPPAFDGALYAVLLRSQEEVAGRALTRRERRKLFKICLGGWLWWLRYL